MMTSLSSAGNTGRLAVRSKFLRADLVKHAHDAGLVREELMPVKAPDAELRDHDIAGVIRGVPAEITGGFT